MKLQRGGAAAYRMFGRKKRPQFDAGAFDSVLDGAKSLYFGKVRPLEDQYLVETFHYPLLNPADLDAKPMVMLIGQYSTGKTSFIRYLLERDFPGWVAPRSPPFAQTPQSPSISKIAPSEFRNADVW